MKDAGSDRNCSAAHRQAMAQAGELYEPELPGVDLTFLRDGELKTRMQELKPCIEAGHEIVSYPPKPPQMFDSKGQAAAPVRYDPGPPLSERVRCLDCDGPAPWF